LQRTPESAATEADHPDPRGRCSAERVRPSSAGPAVEPDFATRLAARRATEAHRPRLTDL